MNDFPPTLAQVIDEYVQYLMHEQHASPTTRTGYQSWLRRCHRFLSERYGRDPDVTEVSVEDVRTYYYRLSRQGLSPRTLRSALYPLRGMFALAVERGYRTDNPALAIKLPKKDAAVRATVSDEELAQLLVGCEREPDPDKRRMSRARTALLIHAGLRRQELLDLEVPDIDLTEGSVLVRSGKGAKSRSVYLCRPCLEAIRDWFEARPGVPHQYLFITDRRRRLGDEGLSRLIEAVKSMADLRDHRNITPHAIRHAAATRLLRNGADLKSSRPEEHPTIPGTQPAPDDGDLPPHRRATAQTHRGILRLGGSVRNSQSLFRGHDPQE
jgi:integrase/recombinase XerC